MNASMSKTFDQGKEEVARLCQHYATNSEKYNAPGIKEADVRQSLIDPFFEALGWDVRNTAMAAPQYREVVPEPSLEVEGEQRPPDYTFRVGTLSKFFVEAKKCAVNIKTDQRWSFQLRRYGWSGKLPLSILTNFAELSVYDCTREPEETDPASHSRILYLRFDEYVERLRELWDVFSREAVWSGAFDQYAASKRKRGTSEVDVQFLKTIEGWREALARNIALRNDDISSDDLTAAVQRTIDRVVFLRMAEDRGLEPYQQLLTLCDRSDIYARFMRDLCRRADEKYNSGLFHFQKEPRVSEAPDRLTPKLAIDDRVFKPIIEGLYFANGSPYHFGVLPVEILGTIYERFLGKVIRLTAGHQAKVEEKPERKAGGVYYTPAYIVDYIVRETVGRQIAAKSPLQLAGLRNGRQPFRVLDMACGSGSFLLGAYRYLLDHCLAWYIENKPATHKKAVYNGARTGQWRLTIEEKKRILIAHIFGVDIDPQAVEVSKLSLLLKVLEGETDLSVMRQMQLFQERALPNLADNIKCGNSLIGPHYFTGKLVSDPDELNRVNPFDWNQEFPAPAQAGGFDCIIGNPPYIRIQTMKNWAALEAEAYKELFRSAKSGNYDIYVVFVERGLQLLNSQGQLGFIVPSKFFATDYGAALRNIIADKQALRKVVDFGHARVFEGATNYTCLLFLSRSPCRAAMYARVESPMSIASLEPKGRPVKSGEITSTPWTFSGKQEQTIADKLCVLARPLGLLPARIGRGSSTGADDVFMLVRRGKRLFTRGGRAVEIERGILRTPIYASDFGRYKFSPASGEMVVFPYDVSASGYELKAESVMKRDYPKALNYLRGRRNELEGRKQFQAWYGFSAPRNLDVHETAQLLVPLLADKGLFCRISDGSAGNCLMASGGFSITVSPACGLSPSYVLGLLNSKLLFWRLRSISNVFRGGWVSCTKQYVETLPVRLIDFSDAADRKRHDRMVALVDAMFGLQRHLAAADSDGKRAIIQGQIDATDREIDRLVYDLYNLTSDEIALVEETDKR